jgi:hypothetical protein
MARILLSDPDPAIVSLLAELGHQPVVLDVDAPLLEQIHAADVVLPNPDTSFGRQMAMFARSAHRDLH